MCGSLSQRLYFIFASSIFLAGCNGHEKAHSPPIVIIKDIDSRLKNTIDEKDFLFNYEFTPAVSNLKGLAAKKDHLELMIDKKLFAAEGLQRGLDQDEDVQNALAWYKNRAIRQQLFRSKVRDKVVINEDEYRDAYIKYKTNIHVRHLPATTEEDARELQNKLLAGATFQELARQIFKDTVLAGNGGDLGFIRWGQWDEDFENAAYALKPGEISSPVQTKWSYHIIQLLDIKTNPLITESGFQARKPTLRKILFKRKQAGLADQYLKAFMKDKHVKVYGPSLVFLEELAKQYLGDEKRLPVVLQKFGDREINRLVLRSQDHLDETIAVFEGGKWTIGDFLAKLKKTHLSSRPKVVSKKTLKDVVARMVRDEFLLEEGYRLGLDKKQYVQDEMVFWQEQVLYIKMKRTLLDTVSVSLEEMKMAYESKETNRPFEELREKIEVELVQKKQDLVMRRFLVELRRDKNISIYNDVLAAVETTDDIVRGTKIQMFGLRTQ